MIHLTPADYRAMPWANGRGVTTELIRRDDAQGMLWRLSMAQVTENGAFSRFPGIDRNLTVIDGPGFDLAGARTLHASPLKPVAFPGDVDIHATNVTAPAVDFNVMWARKAFTADVQVTSRAEVSGDIVAVFALTSHSATLNAEERTIGRHDLVVTSGRLVIAASGPVILAVLRAL
jgi:environmental stress-induced protein Ves